MTEPPQGPVIDLLTAMSLNGDNLLTAARRVVRFLRIDDERGGGLLSQETIQANETLARHVETMEKVIKHHVHADHDSQGS